MTMALRPISSYHRNINGSHDLAFSASTSVEKDECLDKVDNKVKSDKITDAACVMPSGSLVNQDKNITKDKRYKGKRAIQRNQDTVVQDTTEEANGSPDTISEGIETNTLAESNVINPQSDDTNGVPISTKFEWFPHLDVHMSENHRKRFKELVHFFSPSLHQYLERKKVPPRPSSLAIHLKMIRAVSKTIGRLELAQPTILVTCYSKIKSKVKRFFKQSCIKEQYQPGHPSTQLPFFPLVVLGIPPFETAFAKNHASIDMDFLLNSPNLDELSLCGVPVSVQKDYRSPPRIATIGGIILCKTGTQLSFFGLTVGHAAEAGGLDLVDLETTKEEIMKKQRSEATENQDQWQQIEEKGVWPESVEDSSGDDDDSDDGLLFIDPWCRNKLEDEELSLNRSVDLQTTERIWQAFGEMHDYSASLRDNDLDWGLLVTPEFSGKIIPINSYYGAKIARMYFTTETEKEKPAATCTEVTIACGISGPQHGGLSQDTSFITRGSAFVRAFSVLVKGNEHDRDVIPFAGRLSNEKGLKKGDSGSWVFDDDGNLYGHVIAYNQLLGEAYVIPIDDTVAQIKDAIGADDVRLYNGEELWVPVSGAEETIDTSIFDSSDEPFSDSYPLAGWIGAGIKQKSEPDPSSAKFIQYNPLTRRKIPRKSRKT